MLTFTPLSGAAQSSRTSPLAFLRRVDDINILPDCGSPDWCPVPTSSENEGENRFHWEQYCDNSKVRVMLTPLSQPQPAGLSTTVQYNLSVIRRSRRRRRSDALPVSILSVSSTREFNVALSQIALRSLHDHLAHQGRTSPPSRHK
jgi:cleavage and polyadenylation specificity factor subunit 2